MDIDANNYEEDVDTLSHIPPPGEEGFDFSHEGGEFEVFEGLTEDIV